MSAGPASCVEFLRLHDSGIIAKGKNGGSSDGGSLKVSQTKKDADSRPGTRFTRLTERFPVQSNFTMVNTSRDGGEYICDVLVLLSILRKKDYHAKLPWR